MSADIAADLVEKGKGDIDIISDVVNIWAHFLDKYQLSFKPIRQSESLDDRIAKMSRLGHDLGIDHAVHAYFDGVPLEYL